MNGSMLAIRSTYVRNAWRYGRKHQARWAGQPEQMEKSGASGGIEFARHRICQGCGKRPREVTLLCNL